MLKRIHIQNWRSLRDVVIEDLTPITVFIGANSSGKTNIMDALRFLRDSEVRGLESAVYELGYQRILTDTLKPESERSVTLDFTYQLPSADLLREQLILTFEQRTLPFTYERSFWENDRLLSQGQKISIPQQNQVTTYGAYTVNESLAHWQTLGDDIHYWKRYSWQILSENFNPPDRIPRQETGDTRIIEADGRNMVRLLEYLKDAYPELWSRLLEDITYLFPHIQNLRFSGWDSPERRVILDETNRTAPTVSLGTRRLIAVLAAIYALEVPQPLHALSPAKNLSQVLIAEEIDAGLNPGVLQRLVEQLRLYTEGEHPRQILLTTHNPRFLDYFEPEEVRIVKRDEQGFTQVERIPDYIREIWLDKYGLGEVWMTNSLGGLAE